MTLDPLPDEPLTYCNGAITVERRANDWHAFKTGDRRFWAAGRSIYDAIGDLVVHHPDEFFRLPGPAATDAGESDDPDRRAVPFLWHSDAGESD